MTSHAAAGQLQQRPTAREGGLFKRHWFANPVKYVPDGLHLVRSWIWHPLPTPRQIQTIVSVY